MATERPANFRNPGGASRWHSDLVHELQPAGITHLHNDAVPTVGGDTLWASAYEAYDKLSPAYQKWLESLTALHSGSGFIEVAQQIGKTINEPRGSPDNVGTHLTAIQ